MVSKEPYEKFCSDCGEIIKVYAEICPKCGVRQMAAPVAPQPVVVTQNSKNKSTAGLLALLLGGIGAHKFYLGQSGMGLIYLIFCWTFIPAIIGLIEAIQLFGMKDSEFNQKYPS